MRKKLSPRPLDNQRPPRAPDAAIAAPTRRYATVLARARALGLFSVMTIAPLGALAGSVAACGGAAPVQAYPGRVAEPGEPPPPVTTVAPPAASAPTETPNATPPPAAP